MFVYPINGSPLAGLFSDPELEQVFASDSMLERMIRFEAALTRALGSAGIVSQDCVSATLEILNTFRVDIGRINAATTRDGVPVPELVKQLREAIGPPHDKELHIGSTSQDLVDSALAMALRETNSIIADRLQALMKIFESLEREFGRNALMGRTRMQDAMPIKGSDRIGGWLRALDRAARRFPIVRESVEVLQFGGPVGDRRKWGADSKAVAERIAEDLGLKEIGFAWHSDRGRLAEFAAWCSSLTGSLGKIGQDMALMAQMKEVRFEGAGTSSAMPHKSNPIRAEAMVTLARYNSVLVSGMFQCLVHEQERSGSAWALEWMILPQICVATGASLNSAAAMARSICRISDESATITESDQQT